MKKVKYYVRFRRRGIDFKNEVEGYKIDSNCFMYKDKYKTCWIMTDIKSGMYVCIGNTQKDCMAHYNGYYKERTLDYINEHSKWYEQMCEEFETLPVHTHEEVDAMDIKEEPKDYEEL